LNGVLNTGSAVLNAGFPVVERVRVRFLCVLKGGCGHTEPPNARLDSHSGTEHSKHPDVRKC